MDQPGDPNADPIQPEHGGGKDAHAPRIGSRGYDGRHDKYQQNGVVEVLPHETGSEDPHQRQEEDQDGHLENQPHAENNAEKQRRIFADSNHRRELSAEMYEKFEGPGIDDLVTEVSSGREQRDSRDHERHNIALFVAVKTRRDEHPYLVEQKRRSKKKTS